MSDNRPEQTDERRRQLRETWSGPLKIWFVLLVLIGLTTWLGYMPLDHENVAANYPIAGIMVMLVAVFLMRLDEAKGVVWIAALTGLYFLFIMFLLVFGDYFNR